MDQPLEIVILGGGTAGWMAAAALVSLVPARRCRIHLVESDEIGIVGVGEATLPHIKDFNESIGVDESDMMRATKATFKLGIHFTGWGSQASSYVHPFGIHGSAESGTGFHQRWCRSVHAGREWDIDEFSFACMAARANRFDFPAQGSTIKSTFGYGYHFDAGLYSQYLRQICQQRGVVRTEGKVAGIEQDAQSGDIRALMMQSGQRITADFFVDCSGFRSLLLGEALRVEWEDWSKWLPCDRALPVPTERCGELTPYTRVAAMTAGWRWRIPLQHRTGNGYVFSSRFIDEDKAREELLESLDEPILAEPRLLKFSAGRRAKSWVRNCLSLGLSSGFLEPLESTSIYLIQIALMHFLPLLPGKNGDERLAEEFNRLMDIEYARIRDFLILHYHLNDRDDGELWRYCRTMDIPESLQRKIDLFSHSGVIPQYKDGLFTPPSWVSVFLGQGLKPRHHSPVLDGIPLERMLNELEELRSEISDRVEELPRHSSLLARFANSEPASEQLLHEAEVRL